MTIQFLRGTTAQVNAYTGPPGSMVVNTDTNDVYIHDGATQGGHRISTVENLDGVLDADTLDGQEGSYYTDASNLDSGTVPEARLPDATTSSKGAVEFATATEAREGTPGKVLASNQGQSLAHEWVYGSHHQYYSGSSNANVDDAPAGEIALYSSSNSGDFPSGSSFWLITTQQEYGNGAVFQIAKSYHQGTALLAYRNTESESPRVWSPWEKCISDRTLPAIVEDLTGIEKTGAGEYTLSGTLTITDA